MGCCGGSNSAKVIIQAREELDGIGGNGNMANIDPNGEMVRMEYFGPRIGAVSYNGKRIVYRFGNNAIDRFNDVNPEDVETLLRQPGFRVIGQDAQKFQSPGVEIEFVPEPAGEIEMLPAPGGESEEIFAGVPVGEDILEDDYVIPPLEGEGIPPELDIPALPGTVKDIKKAVIGADLDTLLTWLRDEQSGKNRKTAIEAIEDALEDYS